MLHKELTHQIIGCAIEVHKELGTGYPEKIYQRALALELESKGLKFCSEYSMNIYYKGEKIGMRRVDFFIEDAVMLEIKAVEKLNDVCLVQTKNYLESYKLKIGLLINFGSMSLQFKRVFNNKLYN